MIPQLNKDLNGFSRKDNTLSRAVKDYAPDRIELEIGDSKRPNEFMPQAKVMRWNNEVNLSVRRNKQVKSRSMADIKSDHVTYDDDDETVHIYERPEVGEDGGLEIELHLKHKPDTNRLDFSIQTKGLNFFYQPEITDEEAQEQMAEGDKRTLEQVKREMRPENVVGSYAVYHATKRDNRVGGKEYKTGKFCHIYRPHITDAEGNETWGELELDEQSGLLTVVVPQAFLDKAVYPVVVDPTFGYTSVGSSSSSFYGSFQANKYSAPDSSTLESISSYLEGDNSPDSANYLCLYSDNSDLPDSLLSNSISFTLGTGSAAWRTQIVAAYSLVALTAYWLVGVASNQATSFAGNVYFFDDIIGHRREFSSSSTYSSPPASSPTTSSSTRKQSIYATYVLTDAPVVTTQAVSSIGETTATGNGNVTDDGGATITERGVCWSTSSGPTTADSKATSAGTIGAFTASMTGLTASTTYYVRAYAINSEGTSYGSEVSFSTNAAVSLPTVVTNAVTNIQETP